MAVAGSSKFRDLGVRVTVATLYGAVMLGVTLWGGVMGLAALIAVIGALAAYELYEMTRREHRLPNEVFGIAAVVAMPLAAAVWGPVALSGVVTVLLVASLMWHLVFRSVTTSDTAVTVFGAVYVGFSLTHLVLLRGLESGTLLVVTTLASVWANDSFAYLIGSTLGRHRMAPTISPKKSWEGFAAGTVFTVVAWLAAYWLAERYLGGAPLGLVWHAAIGLAVSAAAVVGDLVESRLKREAGFKDSGRMLPGHGGFLDRHDSLILVSLVVYHVAVLGGAR